MVGYLTASAGFLSEAELERYKAVYCGLCRCLRRCYGEAAGLTLNYDMTFLILLLSSMEEPEEKSGRARCLVHPMKGRAWTENAATEYAADMNLALSYLKCEDDWNDDLEPLARFGAAALAKAYRSIFKRYPRQVGAMQKSIAELSQLEASGRLDADAASDTFGRLMAEVFVRKEDYWSGCIRAVGFFLGKFIYLMDACMDLEEDVRKGKYNPFSDRIGREDNAVFFEQILKMMLGECLRAFDRLPLVQDVGILKNILCEGLWQQFREKYQKKQCGTTA